MCQDVHRQGSKAAAIVQVYEDVASAEDRCLAYAQLALAVAERQGYAAAEQVRALLRVQGPAGTGLTWCTRSDKPLTACSVSRRDHMCNRQNSGARA